ncbi:MAG: hypothetical protein HZA80_03085 [Candidatus Taylorbacteria bacterium]|nr:hypothetical protein [Candidatus Taylorbacteria bacterium]
MIHTFRRFFATLFRRRKGGEVHPDEIFIDAHNLPQFDTDQFEGRLESPISTTTVFVVGAIFFIILLGYASRVGFLQIKQGEAFLDRSENNRLKHTPIFASRGVITDRNGIELAWNAPGTENIDVTTREYKKAPGLAHTLGYVQYPTKDAQGFYYREDFIGVAGVEKFFDAQLQGKNGLRLIETNALGRVQSQNVIRPSQQGENMTLSIDSRIQSKLYEVIRDTSEKVGFSGGSGVIMDVHTGEIIAMTSYPEYDPMVMSLGDDREKISQYMKDKRTPFLNRVIDGLYIPGSILKPYLALAALNEKLIDPAKKILSTGSISIPNQYDPTIQTIFRDWKAHGYVDMRHAIAVSSDVYFYAIGGGYKDQKGLGITKIDDYIRLFGFGEKIQAPFFSNGAQGTIPTPEWKKIHFNGESWRLGDTYHTSIGQYGFQVSPVQAVRAVAALANHGSLLNPSIIKDTPRSVASTIDIPESYFKIVNEGMMLSTTEGTSQALNVPYVQIASKSGTAELGITKENVNSWITGYFPYQNPRYAFTVVLEKGSRHNLIGAAAATRGLFDWMNINTPEYFK